MTWLTEENSLLREEKEYILAHFAKYVKNKDPRSFFVSQVSDEQAVINLHVGRSAGDGHPF